MNWMHVLSSQLLFCKKNIHFARRRVYESPEIKTVNHFEQLLSCQLSEEHPS
jgi:hypothetical protein